MPRGARTIEFRGVDMAYEIRRMKNEQYKCPRCFGRTVKAGHESNGKLRRKCQDCGHWFVLERAMTIDELKNKIRKNEDAIKRLKELAL